MYKKLFRIAVLSFLGTGSLWAGSSVLKFEGTGSDKYIFMRMMGELPSHFAGEISCIESIQL